MSPNISLENKHNKQHSPRRAATPATDFASSPIGNSWWNSTNAENSDCCFKAAGKCAFKMSVSTQMGVGTQRRVGEEGRGRQTKTAQRGIETERDPEGWGGGGSGEYNPDSISHGNLRD